MCKERDQPWWGFQLYKCILVSGFLYTSKLCTCSPYTTCVLCLASLCLLCTVSAPINQVARVCLHTRLTACMYPGMLLCVHVSVMAQHFDLHDLLRNATHGVQFLESTTDLTLTGRRYGEDSFSHDHCTSNLIY